MFNKRSSLRLFSVAASLLVGYIALCSYHLESLSGEHLLQMRLVEYDSDAEPAGLAMPGWFKDAYWTVRGRDKVAAAARAEPGLATHAVELAEYFRMVGEPINHEREAQLFGDLGVQR